MKNMLVLAAFGGLAMSAAAQSLEVSITFDETEVPFGFTTARMTARMVGFSSQAYFSLVNVDLLATVVFPVGGVTPRFVVSEAGSGLGWGFPVLGAIDPGTPDGANLLGVFAAQHALFGAVNTSNPFEVMSWEVRTVAEGYTGYTLGAIANTPGMFAVTDPAGNPFAAPVYFSLGDENFHFHSGYTGFVPTPGGMLVLAAGGLVVGRRRR